MPRKRGSIEAVQTPEAKRACIPGLTPAEIVAMAVPEPTRGTHDYTYAPPCARARARSLRPVVAGCEAAVQGTTVPAIRIGRG